MRGRLAATGIALLGALGGAPAAADEQTHTGGAVTIADSGSSPPATPYPATIDVGAREPVITDVDALFTNVIHEWAGDLDFLLVGPNGAPVKLISDSGDGMDAADAIVIDDEAGAGMPETFEAGRWRPFDWIDGSLDAFPAPAPQAAPGLSLTAYDGSNPNGAWQLYVVDDDPSSTGTIGGWGLTIRTRPPARLAIERKVASEGAADEPLLIDVVRDAGLDPTYDATVPYSVTDCSGGPPSRDFEPTSGSLIYLPGQIEKSIVVSLKGNEVPERDGCMRVAIAGVRGDAQPASLSGDVVLRDDDPRAAKPSVRRGRPQRVLRQKALVVSAKSNATGRLAASGSIKLPGNASASLRLRPASKRVDAGETVKLRMRLSKRSLARLARALPRRGTLSAAVKVTATDLAGGKATRKVALRVRR